MADGLRAQVRGGMELLSWVVRAEAWRKLAVDAARCGWGATAR